MREFLLISLLIISIFSCSKDKAVDDKILPTVTINSPSNGQSFATGATVNITAAIADNNKLAEIHIHISNTVTGQLLTDIHRYPNAASYSLNESFQVQNGVNNTIRIIAIDKSANQEMQTLNIVVN